MMDIFATLISDNHEKVVLCNDRDTGLQAIIAVHNTNLGPGLGGIRMRPYPSDKDALEDALRLSQGMTYKAAIAGLNMGGAKTVIIGNATKAKSPDLLRALGRYIESLNGEYIAGQDIGTNANDMAVIREVTKHVSCVKRSAGGAGDPSYVTAYGVVCGIRAVLQSATGSDSLNGRHIVVQGLGNVGYSVARYCAEAGARLTVCDVVEELVKRAASELGATTVPPDEVYGVECDIFSPNSIGGVINPLTRPQLRCLGVCGGANNVLSELSEADALVKAGIIYGPDYLVNSGGLIRCVEEVAGRPTDDKTIFAKVDYIYEQTLSVIEEAKRAHISPALAANRIAEKRFLAGPEGS